MQTACRYVFSLIVICMMAVTSGCAYSMSMADRRLPEGYQLISVPVFKNATQEVGIEVPFTNAIIREIERSQVGSVVPRAEAQVVLEGLIESVGYEIANQVSLPVPANTILNTEYRMQAYAQLQVRRISDGKILWSQKFTGNRSYLAPKIAIEGLNSANALYNHSARQENLSAMAGDMMAEAYGRLTENF